MAQGKFVRATAPASQPGTSMAAFSGKDVYVGRSGVIRTASIKMRGRPSAAKLARKNGPVIVIKG